jgi:hypothetical protein
MKCYLCKRKAQIRQQKGRDICNECFCKLIEKRVRKYSRINKLFKKGDKISIEGDVNKYFIKSMLKDLPIKTVSKKGKGVKNVVEQTMDDETNGFVKSLFLNKKFKKNKDIKLLRVLTDKEAGIFAKIKKLKFKANKKDRNVQKFLDKI